MPVEEQHPGRRQSCELDRPAIACRGGEPTNSPHPSPQPNRLPSPGFTFTFIPTHCTLVGIERSPRLHVDMRQAKAIRTIHAYKVLKKSTVLPKSNTCAQSTCNIEVGKQNLTIHFNRSTSASAAARPLEQAIHSRSSVSANVPTRPDMTVESALGRALAAKCREFQQSQGNPTVPHRTALTTLHCTALLCILTHAAGNTALRQERGCSNKPHEAMARRRPSTTMVTLRHHSCGRLVSRAK